MKTLKHRKYCNFFVFPLFFIAITTVNTSNTIVAAAMRKYKKYHNKTVKHKDTEIKIVKYEIMKYKHQTKKCQSKKQ